MLVTLGQMGIVTLDPPPPASWQNAAKPAGEPVAEEKEEDEESEEPNAGGFGDLVSRLKLGGERAPSAGAGRSKPAGGPPQPEPYEAVTATPTEKLKHLMVFRAVHPLYGVFLMDYLGKAEPHERIQILESLLEVPGSVAKLVRVPRPEELPPGRLAVEVIDPALLSSGLATQEDLYPPADQGDIPPELRKYPIPLAQKVRMVFENAIDHAGGLFVTPVWAVGDLLERGGDFDKFVRARELIKQEGILFKHFLRMILLCAEFEQLTPKDTTAEEWTQFLRGIAEVLTAACRAVDPQSTDEVLKELEDEA
jgi:hypothetical protein